MTQSVNLVSDAITILSLFLVLHDDECLESSLMA